MHSSSILTVRILIWRIMEGNTNRMVSLNGTNYHLWKGKMKNLLFVKKMHLPVFAAQKTEFMFDEEWINSLKFKEGISLSDHLNEFQWIIDQMSGMSIKFEDEILGLLLLNSLPESWETFKVSITNSAPNGVVSLQMVKGNVLNKEMRRKAQGSSSQSEIQECGVSLLSQNRTYTEALFLMEKGEQRKKKGKLKEKDDGRVTTVTGDDLIILRDFELVNFISDESMWIIDSGATLHFT
ncbi:hypothetical protein CR513_19187, partial [Mucuna pruriens]